MIDNKTATSMPRLSRATVRRIKLTALTIGAYTVGIVLALPFLWMVVGSLMPKASDLFVFPPKLQAPHFVNYLAAIDYMNLGRLVGNTLILVVANMALNITASVLVAYGFARFKGRGRSICFALLMSTMMLPWVVTMVPAYMLFSRFNMIGTYMPLILPAIGGTAFHIFMMRQYIKGIPYDLDEAARIDGCNSLGILVKIHLPNCVPILATMLIFSFNGVWGDYVGPSIYIMKEDMYTLSLGLQKFKTSNYTAPPWHELMAGCVMFGLPMVVIFLAAQQAFVRGIVTSGIK